VPTARVETRHAVKNDRQKLTPHAPDRSLDKQQALAKQAELKKSVANSRRPLLTQRTVLIAAFIIVVIVGLLLAGSALQRRAANEAAEKAGENPGYSTVTPNGKSISTLGGWQRISPPEKDPVFAYTDKVGKVSISVSEQPMPASFNNDIAGQVAEVAKKFNATNTLDAGGTKIYIGTSAKGPQSLIFAKNSLLVLIKSQEKVDDKAWTAYVSSLKEQYTGQVTTY